MIKVKYLIIGAGISGLSFAGKIDDDYLIIEKTGSVGGYCKSFKRGDFVWDCGGHFFHATNLEEYANVLNNKNVFEFSATPKIYFKQRFIDYPFQNNIHQLDEGDYKKCISDFNSRADISRNNLLDDLHSKYGKSIVKLFLKPYNEKLYAVDLRTLCPSAIGRFFPKFSLDKVNKPNQYNKSIFYNKNGIENLLSPIFNLVPQSKILFDCYYLSIDKQNKIVRTNKGDFNYDYLINTSPFDEFYKAVDFKEFEKDKKYLNSNKVLLINLGLDATSKLPYHWIYYPEKQYRFYRVGFYNNIANSDKLSMYVEIGLKRNQKVNIQKELKTTIKHLRKAGIIDQNAKLLEYNYLVMDPAYVHISEKSNNIVMSKMKEWQNYDIYSIGRYGRWEYSCMSDSIKQANDIIKTIRGKNNG